MDDSELLQEIKDQLFKITGLDPSVAETILVLNARDDRMVTILDKGFDAMGEYDSVEKSITLYEKSISRCAKDLKCNRANLRLIVMIHEAAHLVTHTGRGGWREVRVGEI